MIKFLQDLAEVFVRHIKGIAAVIIAIVVIIIISGAVLSFKTTQSEFCDSCHYMRPYVRHWEASSHAGVECNQCHDYGFLDLTMSSVRYMTDTYNRRPKAKVPDENCLASDCHSLETLDEDQKFRKGILFKHNVHLEEELRGGKLRCTSCHNQIVQYDDDTQGHMAVNDKSCFLCHFKDAGVGEAITGCNSCHGIPEKEVEHAGFMFNHKPYLELEVECKQCHTQIVRGDGAVPERKCYSCHVERLREDHTEDELHEYHVTDNGIDCYMCHTNIEHSNYSMVGALEIECENCHLRQHNKPKQMYMGIGGDSEIDMPSGMFTAQVTCTGCHTHITPEGEILAEQEKKEASKKSCIACHGRNYDKMFENWKQGSNKVITDYRAFIKAARSDYNNTSGGKQSRSNVKSTLKTAENNFNFVREGHMVHNIQYALFLLDESADNFESTMKKINKSYTAPDRGRATADKSCDTFCHGNAFKPETVNYSGMELPHELHIEDMELDCSSCHSVSEHGKTKIDKTVCEDCHDF